MKAVVLREMGRIEVLDVPVPALKPGEVMVRVTDCGICGSDIRYVNGENPWAQHTLGEKRPNPPNIIPGHEVCGVVEDVAEGADKGLLGKRVAVLSFKVDGTCWWCQHGEEELCPNMQHLGHGAGWGDMEYYYGGMAEYVPVWGTHVFPIPDHISSAEATLLDPLGVAVHAIRLAGQVEGESILVIGTGVIGLLAVQIAKVYNAGCIICSDIDQKCLDLATHFGADWCVNVETSCLDEVVWQATEGIGARLVLDTVGSPLSKILPLVARGGKLIELAVHEDEQNISGLLTAGQRMIMTSANFKYQEYPIAMDLLYTGRVRGLPLITHSFPIEKALEAFQIASNKRASGAIKVVIKP